MVTITSHYLNGKWFRSKAHFDVQDATPTFDDAIATYPIGQERFMNAGNGFVVPSCGGDDGSPDDPDDDDPDH